MFCSQCGTKITEDAAVCPSCGHATKPAKVAVDLDKLKAGGLNLAKDLWLTVRHTAMSPFGGAAQAYRVIGADRALWVGVAVGIIFALVFAMVMYSAVRNTGFYIPDNSGFADFIKLCLVGIVPVLALALTSLLASKLGSGEGAVKTDLYIAGVSMMPFAVVLIVAQPLGLEHLDIIAALIVFALCLHVLILFSSMLNIKQLSERLASWALPVMLLLSGWFASIMYRWMS